MIIDRSGTCPSNRLPSTKEQTGKLFCFSDHPNSQHHQCCNHHSHHQTKHICSKTSSDADLISPATQSLPTAIALQSKPTATDAPMCVHSRQRSPLGKSQIEGLALYAASLVLCIKAVSKKLSFSFDGGEFELRPFRLQQTVTGADDAKQAGEPSGGWSHTDYYRRHKRLMCQK